MNPNNQNSKSTKNRDSENRTDTSKHPYKDHDEVFKIEKIMMLILKNSNEKYLILVKN
ncbi:hypothetical protein [Flavobacterium cheongpyeongense]|uniref:hypothetical protein n=1 Tax=Flavobacterium cheongpyeongense TaxID=2212651 RepID=UPI001403614A|nr:hypothetical protein [Flavobacterium cheongpyeongense]